VLEHEGSIRLAVFATTLLVLSLAELFLTPVPWTQQRWQRLRENFGLMLLNTLVLRLAFPVLAVQFALQHSSENGGGLLQHLRLPMWALIVISVFLLDALVYFQHRLMHWVPSLWRLHRVHHCDEDFDVSLAVRFHPLEIALSMGIKLAAIALLGAPAMAVLIFELALSLGALWTHTRLALPEGIERWMRWIIITPTLHRIHHRLEKGDQDSNFGSTISLWDYLFRSFRTHAQSKTSDFGTLPISHTPHTLLGLLLFPFRYK
jgi:sterol desaturase/sphingolipid hydroxylase (fatty acid hydroxylase superfamily)